ncbi:MAG: hypothetical protein HYZ75_01880 [Elusimicrobia bacterium]|nr:hypothetical protein [Elusimicrobiota bacterium]
MIKRGRAALLTLALSAPAAAQFPGFGSPAVSTAPAAVSTGSLLGLPLAIEGGPWVVGDVQFHGYRDLSLYILQGKVRARRGSLFTPSDVASDVEALRAIPTVESAGARLYAIPDQPVPENYRAIAVSTMMVRLVYQLEEKNLALPGLSRSTTPAVAVLGTVSKVPLAAVSGVVLTPTAYRGVGQYNTPGLALDINAAYFIGRLYGKNNLSTQKTNFIDRLGVWFLSSDAKMQVQSEGDIRPAMAVGAQGIFTFRDSPQPSIAQPNVSVNVSADTTRALGETYIVMSKKIRKARISAGYAYGNAAERIALLTEFLSPQSLQFSQGGLTPIEAKSKDTPFASIMFMPRPTQPLGVEIMKPNGMPLNPILFNFKLGYFLKLNFDLSYLRFQGGWDLLGQFQFRYTHFPRTAPRGSVPGT